MNGQAGWFAASSGNAHWPKEPLRGWAPGNYSCTCVDCGMKYMGDKRSYQCYGCAKKAPTPPMTPDTCPHCGAPLENAYPGYALWLCGSSRIDFAGVGFTKVQSPECARYVRTRISQLKRMAADLDNMNLGGFYSRCLRYACKVRDNGSGREQESLSRRVTRFYCVRRLLLAACLREIDRLRGGA